MVHYAEIAEAESCEMLCVGVEMDLTADDPAEAALWRDSVIAAVRQAYSGPTVYAALWAILNGSPHQPLIRDELDFCGIDAYFRLYDSSAYPRREWLPLDSSDEQQPEVDDLTEGSQLSWGRKWLPRLDSLYRVIHKPVLFPEIGYRSIDSTAWYTAHDYRYGWRR